MTEAEKLDQAINILKNSAADIAGLVGPECALLLFAQVKKSLEENMHFIKTGEKS